MSSEVQIDHVCIAGKGKPLTVVYTGHGSELIVDTVYDADGNVIEFADNSETFLDIYQKVLEADAEALAEGADFLRDQFRHNNL